jgi:hypothetical protein
VGVPWASEVTAFAPAPWCSRISISSPWRRLRRSTSSSIEYHGTASPLSSIVTRPCPRSRISEMNVAPYFQSNMRVLCSSPPVHGTAEAPIAGAY